MEDPAVNPEVQLTAIVAAISVPVPGEALRPAFNGVVPLVLSPAEFAFPLPVPRIGGTEGRTQA